MRVLQDDAARPRCEGQQRREEALVTAREGLTFQRVSHNTGLHAPASSPLAMLASSFLNRQSLGGQSLGGQSLSHVNLNATASDDRASSSLPLCYYCST